MDWARDDACLADNDSALSTAFKYEPSQSTAITIVKKSRYRPRVCSLEHHEQWAEWSEASTGLTETGLVLILARRAGERRVKKAVNGATSIAGYLDQLGKETSSPIDIRRRQVLSTLEDKPAALKEPLAQRSIQTLPFTRDTFQLLSKKMQIHESITRVISRSMVPVFSVDDAIMEEAAFVYNCRTSKAWAHDFALSATHYTGSKLTLAVVYGCTLSMEQAILKRLEHVREEASYPLLVPGILAEIELSRHIPLIETNIMTVETQILQLDSKEDSLREPEVQERQFAKRGAWLDLAYLRNSLLTWNAQLRRMVEHVDLLDVIPSPDSVSERQLSGCNTATCTSDVSLSKTYSVLASIDVELALSSEQEDTQALLDSDVSHRVSDHSVHGDEDIFNTPSEQSLVIAPRTYDRGVHIRGEKELNEKEDAISVIGDDLSEGNSYREDIVNVQEVKAHAIAVKTRRRLLALSDEYEEKIRDCTMRLDGMAMATKWSHSETNVDIALATNRDSNVMKSISLVTMIFLPGTFFATVFSMTFFDWFDSGGKTMISRYVWIYVVITLVFTAATLGFWYFWVIHRRRVRRTGRGEEMTVY